MSSQCELHMCCNKSEQLLIFNEALLNLTLSQLCQVKLSSDKFQLTLN